MYPLHVMLVLAFAAGSAVAQQAPVSVLFVGNSYTFGRVDPVLTYNAAHVRDLTQPQGDLRTDSSGAPFTNLTGTNSYLPGTINPATGTPFTSYSPHSTTQEWGGVAGIFKQMTVQAGLNYDVALSTRNAATLRGHYLNSTGGGANWDLRGNLSSQTWNKVVLQEQSDEPLSPKTVNGTALGSNFASFQHYADRIEDYLHQGDAQSYKERDLNIGQNSNTTRTIPANSFAHASTQVYLQQTWARPNLINPPGATTIDPSTGNATYDGPPPPSFYDGLESMTTDLRTAYATAAAHAALDGSGGFAGIAPVGDTFLRAVTSGVATRNMYASDAATDGLMDLWFNDGTHASVHGSYLSALTLFGTLTGLDPAMLGAREIAARDLGIHAKDALALQRVASDQLGFAVTAVPEPQVWVLFFIGLCGLAVKRRSLLTPTQR